MKFNLKSILLGFVVLLSFTQTGFAQVSKKGKVEFCG